MSITRDSQLAARRAGSGRHRLTAPGPPACLAWRAARCWVLAAGARRMDYCSMLPGPGRYEERYRLTGPALSLASALLALGLGFLWHAPLIFAALTVPFTIPAVLVLARSRVAVRADHAGITLGSERLLPRRRPCSSPGQDVEKIILYPGYSSGDQV